MPPTRVKALPTSWINIARRHGIKLKKNVQKIFYLFDIPSFLYKSSSIVFLHGSTHTGTFNIIEIMVMVLPISIKLD